MVALERGVLRRIDGGGHGAALLQSDRGTGLERSIGSGALALRP
jgi:hypothetical protein